MTQNTTKNEKREQCDTKHIILKTYSAGKNTSGSRSSSPRASECIFKTNLPGGAVGYPAQPRLICQ